MTPSLRAMLHRHLIRDESLTLKPYKCPAGFWTNGVGRNLSARNETPRINTREEAMIWLDEDVATAEADAIKWLGAARYAGYSEFRKAGFVNLSFNLGYNAMFKFTRTREAIISGNWQAAAQRLRASLWYEQVKSRGERVVQLIAYEKEIY